MGQRNTGKLIPLQRDAELRRIAAAIEVIPEDSHFMETLRTKPRLARELGRQIAESIQNFAELHPDEGRAMDITPKELEAAGFGRAAEMVRKLGLRGL